MATYLMTGGHAGLGLIGAKALARQYGCNLILAGRSQGRMEEAAGKLTAETGVRVDTLTLDISSLESVRAAVAACKAMVSEPLSGILCNAGGQFRGPLSYSADGYEETFATNCLGHFLLTNLLLDSVADGGRVVWTVSGTHNPDTMDGKSVGAAAEPDARKLAYEGKNGKAISGGRRYSSSKLCEMLYAYELDRKLRSAGARVASIAYDPGFIPETGLVRTMNPLMVAMIRSAPMKGLSRAMGVTMGELPFSGEALARMAAGPEFAEASGKYFHSKDGALSEAQSSKTSHDERKASKLWSDSEVLVHLEAAERPRRLQ